jgi:BioD-like phosphotransacetylase family protein
MANLYVTSAESYSGKSAVCIGMGMRFRADGLKAGYMKPVNVNSQLREGMPYDDDVVFAKEVFEMPEAPGLLSPVALTPARLLEQLRGPEVDYEGKLMEAYAQVSQGRDVLVLEGGRDSHEGYIAGLPAKRVVHLLNARAVAVLKYDDTLLPDRALDAQEQFGSGLIGVVINEAPPARMKEIGETIVPFIMRHKLPVLAVLPTEPALAAPTIAELAEGLHATTLAGSAHSGALVEHMMVGAMKVEMALPYFRRNTHKAVITGGDRADIQMAALQTSTRCLILTGNLYPSPSVLERANERGVAVLLTEMDTFAAAEVVGSYIGRSRFQQPQKVERFTAILNRQMKFDVLYESLGLKPEPR